MRSVLAAIDGHLKLTLQVLATGMHLDPAHGDGLTAIRQAGFKIDRVIPWPANSGRDRVTTARNTGASIAAMADAFAELKTDIVLVVGDRVEAFAGASAAHLSGLPVAHVHGGDRAAGQVDDSLRHAISKLAHIHFPATRQSADRLRKMGEDGWRIHRAGSPGLDQIRKRAANRNAVGDALGPLRRRRFALVVLHPIDADAELESRRAGLLFKAAASIPYDRIVIVYPNNDPGAGGIIRTWEGLKDDRVILRRDVPRDLFLGLMRDAAVLVGNSSSGIIEAASFGTPVVDIGPRQAGRERGANVANVSYQAPQIKAVLSRLWNNGNPRRFTSGNIHGGSGAARMIATTLAQISIDDRLLRKLIAY
jgi:UDP-N-acetylglucosamine 2-epimerase (non-hydrolysing)/GDP/UDP-N,N'-diacetylbacillosamine 2-epimerase (hydrolysing)